MSKIRRRKPVATHKYVKKTVKGKSKIIRVKTPIKKKKKKN